MIKFQVSNYCQGVLLQWVASFSCGILGFEVRDITTTTIIIMLMTKIMKDCNHQHNYLHLVGFYLAGNHFVPPEI